MTHISAPCQKAARQHQECGVLMLQFPDPVIKIAIEPGSKADQQKMTDALIKLSQEDPSFHFSRDDETNQTVIEGMGELHLVSVARTLSYAAFNMGLANDGSLLRMQLS